MKFKEECMDLVVFIVIISVIFVFCPFIDLMVNILSDKDNKVIEAISAGGLFFFGYWTYKNQQNNEFYSLFNTLLNEHNRLLKDLLESEDKKEKVNEINKKALFKILSSYADENEWEPKRASEKLRKAISDIQDNKIPFIEELKEKKVITDIKGIIEHKVEIKPYLIILFRLLKLIDGTEKIDKEDKREYYALVRGLIPMEILLLILFNSRVWPEKGKELNYKILLERAELFEHLPIEEEALKKAVGLSKQSNEASEQSDDKKNYNWDERKEKLNKRWGNGNNDREAENKEIDSISKQFVWVVYCGGFIGKKAFGQSVYIGRMKDEI